MRKLAPEADTRDGTYRVFAEPIIAARSTSTGNFAVAGRQLNAARTGCDLNGLGTIGHKPRIGAAGAYRDVLIKELAKSHTVIAPDLRGYSSSAAPADGYAKAAMARDVHALMNGLGHKTMALVGHNIGLMVAYAYAAQEYEEKRKAVLSTL